MKSNIKNTVKVGDILTVKPEEQIWVSKVVNDDWEPKNVKWESAEVVKVYKTADEVNNDKEYCENRRSSYRRTRTIFSQILRGHN